MICKRLLYSVAVNEFAFSMISYWLPDNRRKPPTTGYHMPCQLVWHGDGT